MTIIHIVRLYFLERLPSHIPLPSSLTELECEMFTAIIQKFQIPTCKKHSCPRPFYESFSEAFSLSRWPPTIT